MLKIKANTGTVRPGLRAIEAEIADAAEFCVKDAAGFVVDEFRSLVNRQIALPAFYFDRDVTVDIRQTSATVTAKATPVPMGAYDNRQVGRSVDVIINPGQVTTIPAARVADDGQIIGYDRSGGPGRALYGPGVDQIAATEFKGLARQAEENMAEHMQRVLRGRL